MLEVLKNKNPEIEVLSVNDAEFKTFGRVIKDLDVSEIIEAGKKIANPEKGIRYVPTEETFEVLDIAKTIKNELFGTLPTQVGYCWGYSSFMNATEWHTCSEINIAVTDLVLILGHVWDIEDGAIDSSKFKAFYLPAGTAVEVYATTLHYAPCQVHDSGFGCVVGLLADTNTALETKPQDIHITNKNKWLIGHVDNPVMRERGVVQSITGINYQIKY